MTKAKNRARILRVSIQHSSYSAHNDSGRNGRIDVAEYTLAMSDRNAQKGQFARLYYTDSGASPIFGFGLFSECPISESDIFTFGLFVTF